MKDSAWGRAEWHTNRIVNDLLNILGFDGYTTPGRSSSKAQEPSSKSYEREMGNRERDDVPVGIQ